MDKRGVVTGLSVERAVGIQGMPPLAKQNDNFTSRRFWDSEKSRVSGPSASRGNVSYNISHTGTSWAGGGDAVYLNCG